MNTQDWIEEIEDEIDTDEYPIDIFDLVSSPNDFNIMTIVSFIESGVVNIPGFQRHYVWDIKRASKLIESILIGLPIPQIFLYEKGKNQFLVIDGQQRLMTIFYFVKGKFPKDDKRAELRKIFAEKECIPDNILNDDDYFEDFKLKLKSPINEIKNRFNGLKYKTLEDYKSDFDLRTIRNIIVKSSNRTQTRSDDIAMYELFNRLNTGGVVLGPQEVRMSLFHSRLISELSRINESVSWRKILGQPTQDIHMRDVEILLRSLAMAVGREKYKSPVGAFINSFASRMQVESKTKEGVALQNIYIGTVVDFIEQVALLNTSFYTKARKFSVLLFESIFTVICEDHLNNESIPIKIIPTGYIDKVRDDSMFQSLSSGRTTSAKAFRDRYLRAKELLG